MRCTCAGLRKNRTRIAPTSLCWRATTTGIRGCFCGRAHAGQCGKGTPAGDSSAAAGKHCSRFWHTAVRRSVSHVVSGARTSQWTTRCWSLAQPRASTCRICIVFRRSSAGTTWARGRLSMNISLRRGCAAMARVMWRTQADTWLWRLRTITSLQPEEVCCDCGRGEPGDCGYRGCILAICIAITLRMWARL